MRTWMSALAAAGFLATALGASFSPDTAPEKRWPRWRGPADTGSVTEGNYPGTFGPTTNLAWKIALPGKGCSTPIVWDDRIIVTGPDEGQDAVLCFDFTGGSLWKTTVGEASKGKHRNGSAANSSAVTDGTHVFAYFKSGTVAGLELESGKLLWKTNLQKRFGKYQLYWDQGTSPVLTKEHVVVAVMHGGESYLAAFDKQGGKLAWKVLRDYKLGTECDHSYTTPIVYDRDGKETILIWGAEHLTAHDAADGKEIWSAGGYNPEKKGNWVVVGSPVIVGSMAVFSHGRGSWAHGVKLGGKGDVTKTHRAWDRKGVGAFVPTPAASGGNVYFLGDRGDVTCIDPETGKTLWTGRLPKNRAKYYSSPTLAGGKLYAAREDGVVMTASIDGGTFKFLAENDMGEQIIASPVPVADYLLIRGARHLFCVKAQ